MALIVEDGTVVAGAESYISVADATTYHSNRGNAGWAGTTAQMEQALRKATDYMIQKYRPRWSGYRKDGTQVLDWPRTFVYLEPFVHGIVGTFPYLVSDIIVPVEVKSACAELALRALTSTLLADTSQQVIREKIGPIETEYDRYSGMDTRYAAVEALLSIYFKKSGNSLNIVRS